MHILLLDLTYGCTMVSSTTLHAVTGCLHSGKNCQCNFKRDHNDIGAHVDEINNKCVSRLARRKSHHTALNNAAAPNSECSCHAPTQLIRRSHSYRK